MKRIVSFLLVLVMMLSLSVTAYAAETGVVEYRKKNFFFGPGSLHSDTDLFPELKDVMPGDHLTQQVKISHKGSKAVNIRVYIKAEGSDVNPDFIKQMALNVQYKGGDILYEADEYDATDVSGWVRLATLAPGKSCTLDLTLDVPAEMDNEYAEQLGTVIWKFKVEEIPIDTTNAKTGDTSNITLWATVLAVSAVALVVLLIVSKKKKK